MCHIVDIAVTSLLSAQPLCNVVCQTTVRTAPKVAIQQNALNIGTTFYRKLGIDKRKLRIRMHTLHFRLTVVVFVFFVYLCSEITVQSMNGE